MRTTTIILSAVFFSAALAMLSPAYSAEHSDLKKKEICALLEKASASPDETVRVIIKIKSDSSEKTRVSAAKNAANSLMIENSGAPLKNKKIFKSGGASEFVAATISIQELETLASDSRVESIAEDRKMHAFLSESVPLIEADTVWARQIAGENITGKGTAVCVIDTGIDYTHPDLGGCDDETFLAGNCTKIVGGYDFVNSDDDPMDDNGHGTHVAGIIAANGTLKGVAPDAKIIAIKALGSDGSGSESDVALGINWCVANSTKFNITAISMSLGGSIAYSSYCDDSGADNALFAESINAAIAKNISVVIATGNNGSATSYSGVSSPACIENATRVTATDKSDNYASFAERGAGFPDTLAAPGSGIVSTYRNSGQATLSGTSMSTPHVSGAIAILSQAYRELYGTAQTPQYFRSLLNSTGLSKNDTSGAKINFSRINVLSAYNALVALRISIVSPENGTFLNSSNTHIIASQNAVSWMNYSIDSGNNISACQDCDNFQNYSANLAEGLHNLTVYGNNSVVSLGYATIWFTTDKTAPALDFSGASEANNSVLERQWIFANISINETNFASATFFLFNSSGLINSTTATDEGSAFANWTALQEGKYYFNATVIDKAGNSNGTETRKITIDLTPPAISGISFSPALVHTGDNVTITYSIADISPVESNISITHDNLSESVNYTNSGEKYTAIFSNVSNVGEYNIAIYAKDAVNFTSNSGAQFFANATTVLSVDSAGNDSITLLIMRENDEIGSFSAAAEEKNESFEPGNYTIEARGENRIFAITLEGVEFAPNEALHIFFSDTNATTPDSQKFRFTNNTFSFSPQFDFSSATVCLNYTQYTNGLRNVSRAKNFKCPGLCENGNWSALETSINEATNQSCSNVSSFSSFVLGELLPYCGDGNIDAGETCASCPADAASCPVTSSETSGNSGWGSGIIIPAKNSTNAANASVAFKDGARNISAAGNISIKAQDTLPVTKENSTELAAPEIKTEHEENKNISESKSPISVINSIINYLKPFKYYLDWLVSSIMILF